MCVCVWLERVANIDIDGAHICAISLEKKRVVSASNLHPSINEINCHFYSRKKSILVIQHATHN